MAKQEDLYPSPTELADLSALADGRLDPSRRQAVEDRIASSVHLRAVYDRERAAVEVLQQAAVERAPARLRARVEAPRRRAARTQVPSSAALAGALAAAAAALALLLPGGTPGSPSVSQAARLALRGASASAPAPDPSYPRARLVERLQGVYFPNWLAELGWGAVGLRRDRLGGRPTVTVYYQWRSTRVAYTIVGAPALSQPVEPASDLNGFELRTLNLGARTVVTWRRAGHTCVLSAAGVPANVLQHLAAWRADGLSD